MAVISNHGVKDCVCKSCTERTKALKQIPVLTQELLDEHTKMKEDIDYLFKRIKFLESGEGF